MPHFRLGSMLILIMLAASPAFAADALFRSSFESSICDIASPEEEPNDTAATANPVILDSQTHSAIVCGVLLGFAGDVDYFSIAIQNASTAVIETIKADGTPCDPGSPMSLTLFDPSGTTMIATDTAGGVDGCASLDGESSVQLQNLAPGTYFIRLSVGFNMPVYALSIRLF